MEGFGETSMSFKALVPSQGIRNEPNRTESAKLRKPSSPFSPHGGQLVCLDTKMGHSMAQKWAVWADCLYRKSLPVGPVVSQNFIPTKTPFSSHELPQNACRVSGFQKLGPEFWRLRFSCLKPIVWLPGHRAIKVNCSLLEKSGIF